jgi:hypothetical protein
MRRTLPLFAVGLLTACSTELDINAPYQEHTVVYGLLNMRDSLHWIKVNKAFLGEGDALVYAAIPDSNEYQEGDITYAKVFRVVNGNRVDSFPVRDTLLNNRPPGVFFHPTQRVYYIHTPTAVLINGAPQISTGPTYLHQNSTYELVMDVRGRRIQARAAIVNDLSLPSGSLLQLPTVNLYSTTSGYVNPEFKWNSGTDGKRYVVSYRFNYREVRGTDTIPKVFEQVIGTAVTPNSQTTATLSVTMGGELFYSNLANAIPDDPAVTKRIFTGMDILFAVANDEFHTYLSLTEPVSGIVEERPDYTNIDGAFGIFASRYTRGFLNKRLNDPSLNELINGPYTSHLRFCSAFTSGPPYGCD